MRVLLCLTLLLGSSLSLASVSSLGGGWVALTEQSDPFDTSKKRILQISKQEFTVRCRDINFSAPSYGYESLSFGASIQYMVDGGEPIKREGKYSTYLGGSDLMTDSRYYSFRLDAETVNAMKAGLEMKMAGTRGSGWTTKALDLTGFTKAYNRMCGAKFASEQLRPKTAVSSVASAIQSEMVSASDFAKSYNDGLTEVRFRGYKSSKNGAKLVFVYDCAQKKNVVGNLTVSIFGHSTRGSMVQNLCDLEFDLSNADNALLKQLRALTSTSGMEHWVNAEIPLTELSLK